MRFRVAAILLLAAFDAVAQDGIAASLTGARGDPARGRAIVADRQAGLCVLCHRAPVPGERAHGTLGPDLAGVGARLSEGQIRARMLEPRLFNPDTVMPAYLRTDGLERVAPAYAGRPVLDAAQIEDVVAYLVTLR